MFMPRVLFLRHGQSQWNLEHRFTGWVDVDLTAQGEAEAAQAGVLIGREGLAFDRAYTSVLKRAIRTNCIALAAADQLWIPVAKDWRLNERHYGALTGLDKDKTAERHGADQVRIWRRSYDIAPPPLAPGGEFDFAGDRRYAAISPPATESLKTTLDRVQPYWSSEIAPRLVQDETLLVTAHGNSLRAIVKHLFKVANDTIVKLEIPTGNPLLVDLSEGLIPVAARYLDAARSEALPDCP
jgi:2,3-bisphosphoglycerate-dependent phosphoglycerate mutase